MKVRTTHEMEEECFRTLYIRLPHSIRDADEIRELFFGDITIKLPRQRTRHCKVVFSSVGEKFKNYKALRNKLVDNKHVIARNYKPSKVKLLKKPENLKKKKKAKPAKVNPPTHKVTKICIVKNIPKNAKLHEISKLLPEAKNVSFLPRQNKSIPTKWAIVKFKDIETAAKYLNKQRVLQFKNVELNFAVDTRNQKSKKLKIFDGKKEEEIKTEPKIEVKEEDESENEDNDDDDEEEDDDSTEEDEGESEEDEGESEEEEEESEETEEE